ncbi:MAG TPA: AAA family ATPase [Nitrososphaerales archaeon]|nr:AAA family ATPase [Nitrososphaerales archaeon]
MLTERVRPKKIAAMVGNEQARLEIVRWLKHWKTGSKPLLLTGPPGVGKSTSIYAIANEFGYTVLEYNASDVRTRDKLREALSPTLENASIFNEEKLLIFLDEIDGMSGRSDYAGMDFVLDFIENATMPVAMAANLEETQKLKKIEQKSLVLRFLPVSPDVLVIYLRKIAEGENLKVPDDILGRIAKNSRGDVRQAISTLQTLSGTTIVSSSTDRQFMSDSSALDAVLKAETLSETLSLFRQYDAQPYEKIRSIYDSVVSAKNLSIESKAESLDLISQADTIMGKISQNQSWRLLRYLDRFLAAAILSKKIQRNDSSIPWNLRLAVWNDGKVLKQMSESLTESYHAGKSDIAGFYLPFMAFYFKNRPTDLDRFLEENNFGDSERRVISKMTVRK